MIRKKSPVVSVSWPELRPLWEDGQKACRAGGGVDANCCLRVEGLLLFTRAAVTLLVSAPPRGVSPETPALPSCTPLVVTRNSAQAECCFRRC